MQWTKASYVLPAERGGQERGVTFHLVRQQVEWKAYHGLSPYKHSPFHLKTPPMASPPQLK